MPSATSVDIIYHASFTDAEGMDMLEANKDWVFVAPGINWLVATLYEAETFGFPQEAAEAVGYKRELEVATTGLRRCTGAGSGSCPAATTASPGPRTAPTRATCSISSSCSGSPRWRRSSRPPRWAGEIMLRPDELGKVAARLPRRPAARRRRPARRHHRPAGPRPAALHHEGRPVPQGGHLTAVVRPTGVRYRCIKALACSRAGGPNAVCNSSNRAPAASPFHSDGSSDSGRPGSR